jgi:cysteinyl-tRNA synthetase
MAAYEVADRIRDVLTGLGIEVTDEADGTTEFHLPG